MTTANGVFDIDEWDARPYDQGAEGPKLARVHVGKTFRGDLEGTSTAELLTVVTADDAPLAYCGIERFDGTLGGLRGTFVLQHTATASGGGSELAWAIVTGSGTGALAGITGTGGIDADSDGGHTYTLEYRFE
ncbi:DUF3224 domain-containing protein [Spongiactinospora sp. TRM90649]|uniref:DUF3224 domain-containing protein n=1 Tax=Spongiactinospora sp. TRM90649 TaxID=3031114 RepID=UPI0023F7FD63|nr:DUF3224 domain-containing protein [Spongiactinospora sp. TRM90649]MDF5753762.1 DUF3224 domain-containing protein [Spongiactinospora sp. TRM90649]